MDQATNFANSKKRMIRMSAKGAAYVKTADGKKQYTPKAAFKKTPDGVLRKLTRANAVPKKIAPARIAATPKAKVAKGERKTRVNRGVARGPREETLYRMIFDGSLNTPQPKVRKTRSNKGKARGLVASAGGGVYKGRAAATRRTAVPKRMRTNPFAALMSGVRM